MNTNPLPRGNFLVTYLLPSPHDDGDLLDFELYEDGFSRINQALNAMDVILNDTDARNVRLWAVGSDGRPAPLQRVQFYRPAAPDTLYSDTVFMI